MNIVKKIILMLFSVFISISAYAIKVELNQPNYAGRYHLFGGFDFSGYVPSPAGLDVKIADEYNYIINNETSYPPTDYYSIVGHSQGGLRVLAYSTYLKSTNPAAYNKLQAVITVSGIDKGLLALDGGFGPLNRKFREDIGIVYDGAKSVIASRIPLIDAVNYFFDVYPSSSDTENKLINNLPDNFQCYVKPALNGADPNTMAEIRDMFPRSGFNRNYVSDSIVHTYKVQTRVELYWDWCVVKTYRVWGHTIKIWGWASKTRPIYEWFTAWEDVPKFGNELPTGYIVGLNSNTLSMTGKESAIRFVAQVTRDIFDQAYHIHSVAQWTPFGFVMNSRGNADRAKKARNWMDDIDGEFNELKGSSLNDGLVAKESQYFPKTFRDPNTGEVRRKHTNVLGNDPKGYVGMLRYNHKDIGPDTNEEVKAKIAAMMDEARFKRVR